MTRQQSQVCQRLIRWFGKPGSWLLVVIVYCICFLGRSYHYALPQPVLQPEYQDTRNVKVSSGRRRHAHQYSNATTTTSNNAKDGPIMEPQAVSRTNSSSSTSLKLLSGPVFFNIYVSSNVSNVRRILKEQFFQHNLTSPETTIEYILIQTKTDNKIDIVTKDEIQQVCPACRQRKVLVVGGEVDTLQELWDYCHDTPQKPRQDVIVTYIHNKGSFHPTFSNEKSRRMGTKAALECRDLMISNPHKCNICTSAFHIFPQYLGSSNMWSARCSYIRGLHPPSNYSNMMEFMYQSTLNHSQLADTKYACLKPGSMSPNHVGLGRFAIERWPFSHPLVKPCDVMDGNEGLIDEVEFPQTWQPKFQRAPHQKPKQIGIQFQKTSFARLAGRLFEWNFIYHQAPTNTSWVWKWYRGYEEGKAKILEKCRPKEQAYYNSTAAASALSQRP